MKNQGHLIIQLTITPVIKKVDILFDYFRKQIKEHKETIDDCNIRDFTDDITLFAILVFKIPVKSNGSLL
jgi:hypothetical protein